VCIGATIDRVKTLAHTVVGRVLLSALAVKAPSDEEWESYLQTWLRMPGGAERGVMVFTDKAGPTSAQRVRLEKVLDGKPQRTAVITGSAVGRLMVAAVAWANPAIRAFAPERIADAFAFLEVPLAARAEVLAAARLLIAEVGAEVSAADSAR
jgi:hypothetical protein